MIERYYYGHMSDEVDRVVTSWEYTYGLIHLVCIDTMYKYKNLILEGAPKIRLF